jgi:hypothetical protein
MAMQFIAVWGNGRLATEAGILGVYATREEAQARVDEFLDLHADNPAVGAWVEVEEAAQPVATYDRN